MAVIVTVLATLLTGEGISKIKLGPWASFLGAESSVVFLGAGVYAWLTMIPLRYRVGAISALRRVVESEGYWAADPRIGTRRSAESHLDLLRSLREANRQKAARLAIAMALELVAVGLLAATVLAYINRA